MDEIKRALGGGPRDAAEIAYKGAPEMNVGKPATTAAIRRVVVDKVTGGYLITDDFYGDREVCVDLAAVLIALDRKFR